MNGDSVLNFRHVVTDPSSVVVFTGSAVPGGAFSLCCRPDDEEE